MGWKCAFGNHYPLDAIYSHRNGCEYIEKNVQDRSLGSINIYKSFRRGRRETKEGAEGRDLKRLRKLCFQLHWCARRLQKWPLNTVCTGAQSWYASHLWTVIFWAFGIINSDFQILWGQGKCCFDYCWMLSAWHMVKIFMLKDPRIAAVLFYRYSYLGLCDFKEAKELSFFSFLNVFPLNQDFKLEMPFFSQIFLKLS